MKVTIKETDEIRMINLYENEVSEPEFEIMQELEPCLNGKEISLEKYNSLIEYYSREVENRNNGKESMFDDCDLVDYDSKLVLQYGTEQEVSSTEIMTTRYFYPHGIEGETTETTLKEWDNLDSAIKYARRYAKGNRFAGVEIEVNRKVVFEITSDFEEIDHRETEKPQGIFKVVGVSPETGNKQDCVLFARGEEYYVTFEPHLQNATHKSLVWHWYNTDDKIYKLSDEEIELYFNLDAEIAEKIKYLSQIAWDETETMADYHDELGRIIESTDDTNYTLWWYYFTTSNTVHIEDVRE